MEELKKALKPVKRKILIEKAVCRIMLLLSAGFLLCTILIILGKFMILEHLPLYILLIFSGSLILAGFLSVKNRPDDKETALKADLLGFKERFITIFQWEGEKNSLWNLVMEDALHCVKSNDIGKLYRIKVNKKIIYLFIISIVLMISVVFVPSPNRELFQNIKAMRMEELEKIEAFEEKSKDTLENLEEKQRVQAEMVLEQLKKEVKNSLSKEETQNAVNTAAEELMKLSKNSVSDEFKSLSSMFKNSETSNLNSVSDGMSKARGDKAKEELKKVYDEIENMSSDEQRELAEQIREGLDGLAAGAFNEMMENLAEALEIGDLEAAEAQMTALGDYLSEETELWAATEQLSEDFTDMFLLTSKDSENTMAESQGAALAQSDGNSSGETSESQSGSGRGEGHIENQNGYNSENANKDFQVFSPKGNLNERGSALTNEEKLLGSAGEYMDYEEIIGEYSQEALSSLEHEDLPYGMKEIIRTYFSRIHE